MSTRPRPEPTPAPDGAVRVWTDGACSGNPGPGGWAWALDDQHHASGSDRATTNQRMEIHAVLDALTTLLAADDRAVHVISDSTYVVNCFRDRWWQGWEQRGWRNSQKQPVANQDLWRPLLALYKAERERISFGWVKGHSGDPMNDLVDRLAVAAAQTQSPRTSVGVAGSGASPAPGRGQGPLSLFD